MEAAVGRGVQFMKNVKIGMDLFGEKNGPSIIMEFDVYKNNYVDVLKKRRQNTIYYRNYKRKFALLLRIKKNCY